MADLGPLMRNVNESDVALASNWSWVVPEDHTPLFLSIFGDWVFGARDGSLWGLSTLEGSYERIAGNSAEFNALKGSPEWLDKVFLASWQEIAARHGIVPSASECITWKVPPVLGGAYEVNNLQLLPQVVYQPIIAQVHKRLVDGAKPDSSRVEFREPELPRWIQLPVGIFLGLFTLLCLAGSATLVFAPPEKAPIMAAAFGVFMAIACFWILEKCFRLITGREIKGGLMGPPALRVIGWFFLLLPIGGLFTGYFRTHTLIAIVQTAAYISAFFGLRRLAATREKLVAHDQSQQLTDPSSTAQF